MYWFTILKIVIYFVYFVLCICVKLILDKYRQSLIQWGYIRNIWISTLSVCREFLNYFSCSHKKRKIALPFEHVLLFVQAHILFRNYICSSWNDTRQTHSDREKSAWFHKLSGGIKPVHNYRTLKKYQVNSRIITLLWRIFGKTPDPFLSQ